MEWFVAIIFATFISGLLWVTTDAVRHANKAQPSTKSTVAKTRDSRR